MEVVSCFKRLGVLIKYRAGKFLSILIVNIVFPGFVGTQEKDVICTALNFAPVYSGLRSKYILLSILSDSSYPRN